MAYLFRHHEINRTAFKKKVEKKTDEFQERKVNEALCGLNDLDVQWVLGPSFLQVTDYRALELKSY